MNRLLSLVLLSIISIGFCQSASSLREQRHNWSMYKKQHRKNYLPHEETVRFQNFITTQQLINDHNSDPESTYTLGNNELSDWTDEEIQGRLGAVLPDELAAVVTTTKATTKPTTTTKTTTKPTTTTKTTTKPTTTTKTTTKPTTTTKTTTKPTTTTKTTTKPTTTTKTTTKATTTTKTTTKPTTTTKTTTKPTTASTTTPKPTTTSSTTLASTTTQASGVSLDLRTTGCIGPIKNQGQCGSCWAFGAICPLEYSYCEQHGNYTAFSEQQLVDCDTSNSGCGGGWPTRAWSYLKNIAGGIDSQASYPYTSGSTGSSGTCSQSSKTPVAQVATISAIASGEASIIAALQNGPVAVAFWVTATFNYYSSGVYANDAACPTSTGTVNHAVVIVGYNVDPITGLPYWIARNSWGTGWGIGGYVHYQRGVNLCNIETWPMQATTN